MTVELAYAKTHLSELVAAVDDGESVTIARHSGEPLRLLAANTLVTSSASSWRDRPPHGHRHLGELAGTVAVPTLDEWRDSSEEIAKEFYGEAVSPEDHL